MARKKKQEPEVEVERPVITHWRDWIPVPEVEVEPEDELVEDEETAKPKSKKRALALSMAVVALAAIGGGGVFYMANNQAPAEITIASQQEVTVTATPVPEIPDFCASPGATSDDAPMLSPEGVIQHLQYAYYVTQDSSVAFDTYASSAAISAEGLQAAIESTPEGTHHCLIIDVVDEEAGLVNVDLQVQDPDGSYRTYLQKVTTTQLDNGEFRITAVEERKELE